MAFSGPAKGNEWLKTKFSADGTKTRGTNNNCANGYTPWGTYLTCEENWLNVVGRAAGDNAKRTAKDVASLNRYGLPEGRKSPYLWDTAGTEDLFARWTSSVVGATAADDYRNTAYNFGWNVEIDPFNPTSVPVKRTALGRMNHEGAWPAPAVVGQPIVIYQGDDARNEYIYKFVSKALWSASDVNGGLAAGAKYLDEGTLYVAKFNADGSGAWLELTHGKNGLDSSNATFAFANQGDVVINARLAADFLGATKMDRPEWGAVNPLNGEAYMTLTNNSNRGQTNHPGVDAANPRANNTMGQIIRWRDTHMFAGDTFVWNHLLLAGDPAKEREQAKGNVKGDFFGCPDGLS
jgi:secreted PhoX family phosphatase